jgi:hypothetical protein
MLPAATTMASTRAVAISLVCACWQDEREWLADLGLDAPIPARVVLCESIALRLHAAILGIRHALSGGGTRRRLIGQLLQVNALMGGFASVTGGAVDLRDARCLRSDLEMGLHAMRALFPRHHAVLEYNRNVGISGIRFRNRFLAYGLRLAGRAARVHDAFSMIACEYSRALGRPDLPRLVQHAHRSCASHWNAAREALRQNAVYH